MIETLCNDGHFLFDESDFASPDNDLATLFVATYDPTAAIAPWESLADGRLSSVTLSSLTDDRFEYGVDYLASWLLLAEATWRESHQGEPPDGIDILAHGEGGTLVRAYVQSDAYPDGSQEASSLPAINHFVMIGAPQTGVPQIAEEAQDDWPIDPLTVAKYGLGALIAGGVIFAGAEVLAGAAVPVAVGVAAIVVGSELVTGEDILQLVDEIPDIKNAVDFVRKLLGGEENSASTETVVEDTANYFGGLELIAPVGVANARLPTFQWRLDGLPQGETIRTIKLFVSTQ